MLHKALDHFDSITWLTRTERAPGFNSEPDDPLVDRRRLWERAHASLDRVDHLYGRPIVRVETHPRRVHFADGEALDIDTIIATTGFRPDNSLLRELQYHACWASEGPMKLAAALLSTSGGDCLAPKASGPELLKSPEPRLFVLGAKSYGRRNDFLLQNGHTQVEELVSLLQD